MTRKVETLARFSLFKSLSAADVARLDTQCLWRRAREKECIVDFQDDSSDVYFVAYGDVRVSIQSAAGKELILRVIAAGEYFGEISALDGKPRSAAVHAITDAVIARMSPGAFREVIHRHPDVCDQILAALTGEVRRLATRVNEFTNLSVRERIHAELLRLARRGGADDMRGVISPPPTHAELAARVSTHREAVTRELNSLERAGLLERRRGSIVLLDLAKLAESVAGAQ
ncbi:Crp/Fnr family transcriptional regulator [Methylocystis heyeri]|uniref:Cyclic nucleotide-binding domain-containing protein n=1 Tax=Methylocystis heyeri TaxID=391905 RepID=A0A6B8KG12_9HYPH|nr:Crp/Fnr family transcriptional regulator [Methylocystis heyeri]QGM47256.1 cyclic nucleotide-binding domain-containing protein [Methylocystis heyeri]